MCSKKNNSGDDVNLKKDLEEILAKEEITTVFQPIVLLENGVILGYEALSRGKKGSPLEMPQNLFLTAEKYNKSLELEYLCRKKAIERAKNLDEDKKLFINVDPRIFNDIKVRRGSTIEIIEENNISKKNIIFEITEKNAISDYDKFNKALLHYKEQGYEIAVDDTGAGYSGLTMLSRIKPNYVKIDMDLIRDIHKDKFKQALIESFVKFSEATNMKLIAEGIECKEELEKLMKLGVYAGQGFYLERPKEGFSDISSGVKEFIISYNISKNIFSNKSYIGDVNSFNLTFDSEETCQYVKDYLNNAEIPAACIIEDDKPVGLIMKHIIDSKLATQYGVSIFYKRSISLIMDSAPIIVDYYTDVEKVSNLVMSREIDKTYDCIIVTKDGKFHSIVTIRDLLEFITKVKFDYAKKLNPLTGLPGNLAIQDAYNIINKCNMSCCILYLDLDHFKVYNDTYGFKKGDLVINLLSKIIKEESSRLFPVNGFIGHIGGDDFICIVDKDIDKCKLLCESIISRFDEEVKQYVDDEHIEKGYILSKSRQGILQKHRIVSVSIAGVYGNLAKYKDFESLSEEMAVVKKQVKGIEGSAFILNEL